MKTAKLIMLVSILFLAGIGSSYSQTADQSQKRVNGGLVEKAGDHQIEMVQGKDSIIFYVQDAKQKTVANKNFTGTVVFDFFNKTKATSPLAKGKKNSMFVAMPKANIYTYCTVSLMVNGKETTAKFKNINVWQSDIEHGHQH